LKPSFDSPKSLIGHAKEDLKEFQSVGQKAVTGPGVHANVVEIDPETGNKTFKAKFVGTIPSRARYIANNILNNLRHSLDQAAVAAFESVTGTPTGTLLYFPIANSPADLGGKLTRSFPVELHPVFKSFEPYPRGEGHDGGNDALCILSKAAGPNKHQVTLSPVLDTAPEMIVNHVSISGDGNASVPVPRWDIANSELIIGTCGPNSEFKYDLQMAFHIAFGDAGPLFRQPVIPTLHQFATIADHVVLALEAETGRIIRNRKS
jgi:hypothetical protein